MSLIADALKRAQEQRTKDRPGKDDDDRARRMLSPSGPLRVDADTGRTVPRSVGIAGAVLAAAVVTAGGVVWLAPSAGEAGTRLNTSVPVDTRQNPSERVVDGPTAQTAIADRADGGGAETAGTSVAGMVGGLVTETQRGPEIQGAAAGTVAARPSEAGGGDRREASSFSLTLQGRAATAERSASELFGRALSAQQRGDLRGAASLYRAAIDRNPGDPQLHNNLGTVYRALSMPGEALAAFQAATEVDASYAPAWSNLGIMLDGLGRDGAAIEAFREALRQDPSNTGARVNLANKYVGMGLVEEARELLRSVLRDSPALPEAHYAMARALEAAGAMDEAVRHYRVFLDVAGGRFPQLESRVRGHLRDLEGGGS